MSNKEIQKEGLFSSAKKFSDAFFDGLKTNAVNSALEKAKKSKEMPIPIVKKMDDINKLAKELEKMLKDYE
jgi:hypothetical protein